MKMKGMACPHCGRKGCLILHGYLYGYSESDSFRVKRGRRIFCSGRKNKKGCGRTFSMHLSGFIPDRILRAGRLWDFLSRIRENIPVSKAFKDANIPMSSSSAYRIFKDFTENQPAIRTLLIGLKDPPVLPDVESPAVCTIFHLESVFKNRPVSAFQEHFNRSFL